jgi:hypothetical protein
MFQWHYPCQVQRHGPQFNQCQKIEPTFNAPATSSINWTNAVFTYQHFYWLFFFGLKIWSLWQFLSGVYGPDLFQPAPISGQKLEKCGIQRAENFLNFNGKHIWHTQRPYMILISSTVINYGLDSSDVAVIGRPWRRSTLTLALSYPPGNCMIWKDKLTRI